MFTSGRWNGRNAVSAAVAAAIVGISGLALDRGHMDAGAGRAAQLAAEDVLPRVTALPEVVVTAPRIASNDRKSKA